jgi:hypothetical protein
MNRHSIAISFSPGAYDPTFKGCLQRIDISGQILGSEQISPKNYQENQRVVKLPLERGYDGKYLTINKTNIPKKRAKIIIIQTTE